MNMNVQLPPMVPLSLQPQQNVTRNENRYRELVPQLTKTEPYKAETEVGSEKDKSKVSQQQAGGTHSTEAQNSDIRTVQGKEQGEGQGSEQQPNQQQASDQQDNKGEGNQAAGQLTPQEQKIVDSLESRHNEVVIHERAHASVGGQHAGQPSYGYENGPDGKRYAVSGEVPISVSPIAGDPQATIQKMRQVRAAALAPQSPSVADRRIAAEATRQLNAAYSELAASQKVKSTSADSGEGDNETQASRGGLSAADTQTLKSEDIHSFNPSKKYGPITRSEQAMQTDRAIEQRYFGSVVPNERPALRASI
ncbi:putative metalloprotease CJM1_0395 family protein [Motilimonas cestriensis]|uniref:putative metalloprotease CJM1_0395 family protein n=1 Tax=Motilimonas cestriensis TaxID=2742685 RepID=UPI003DA52A2F